MPRSRPPSALWQTPVDSPLGTLTLVFSPAGLRAVHLPGHPRKPAPPGLLLDAEGEPAPGGRLHNLFQEAAGAFRDYFAGRADSFARVDLDPIGTPFQLRVWAATRDVAFGCTLTYGELAARLGIPQGARAVGQALGANPLLIVTPCHRILATGGHLGGFSAGLALKRLLLSHERTALGGTPFPLYGAADCPPNPPLSAAALLAGCARKSCRRKKLLPS